MISFYDVVVVGDELAGAIAGALLATRGYRVLYLGKAPLLHDELAGQMVTSAPLALTGIEGPVWKRVTAELQLHVALRRKVALNHPAFQLLMDEHRIDVGDELGRELGRELGEAATAFDTWTSAAAPILDLLDGALGGDVPLPPEGFWERRRVRKVFASILVENDLLGALPAGSPLRALATVPARFGCDLDAPGSIATARVAEVARRGVWSLPGGREALRALFLERITAHAGELRHDVAVRGLVTRRGRVVGVGVGEQSQTVGCHAVIGAADAHALVDLYPETPPRRLREAAALEPVSCRRRVHWVVPLGLLPDPLGALAYLVRDPAAPLLGGNAIALYVHSAESGEGQQRALTTEVIIDDDSDEALAAIDVAVRKGLGRVIPFLDEQLIATAPSSAPLDPLWSLPAPALGVCGIASTLGVKGLYIASRQVLPGLGVEGELCAAWRAARLVSRNHKRKEVDKGALFESR